jgi:putative endonuclease
MKQVYVLESIPSPGHHYVGITGNLVKRFESHDSRELPQHTRRFAPWRLKVVLSFTDDDRAAAFERYLKTGSGRAFAKRHFE